MITMIRALAPRPQLRMLLTYALNPKLLARIQRQLLISGAVFLTLGVLLYVLSFVFLAPPRTVDAVGNATFAVLVGVIFLAVLPYYIALYPLGTKLVAADLRQQMAGRALDLYPPVPVQPQPLPAHEMPTQRERIRPLAGLIDGVWKWSLWPRVVILFVYGFFMAIVALFFAVMASTPAVTTDGASLDMSSTFSAAAIGTGILALFFLATGVSRLRRAIFITRGQSVAVDAQGLRWKDSRFRTGKHAIAWDEISGFGLTWLDDVITERSGWAYLLIGKRDTLLWALPTYPSPKAFAATDRLARLVMTHTGLPLRDVSSLVVPYAQARSVLSALRPRRRAQALRAAGVMLPADTVTDTTLRRAARKWWYVWGGLVVIALLFALWCVIALVA